VLRRTGSRWLRSLARIASMEPAALGYLGRVHRHANRVAPVALGGVSAYRGKRDVCAEIWRGSGHVKVMPLWFRVRRDGGTPGRARPERDTSASTGTVREAHVRRAWRSR
jgi:hypothetical protein